MGEPGEQTSKQRDVVVDDPNLSTEANEALTAEARKALGAKRVPARGQGDGPAQLSGGTDSTFTAALANNRFFIAFALFVLLLVGVIVSIATDRWIFLGVAVFAHAVATVVWAFLTIQLASEPEQASPPVSAMLEEEGVAAPDARLGEIVKDFKGGDSDAHHPSSEPATSVAQSAPAFMIWLPAAGLLLISAITPFVADGPALWLVPAVLWPLVLSTMAFAWGKPRAAEEAVSQHPRAMAAAAAFGVLGLSLLLIGVIAG